jgi:hypothetical protein
MDPYYKEKLEGIADELGLLDLIKYQRLSKSTDTLLYERYKKRNERIKRRLQEAVMKINDSTSESRSKSSPEILKQLDKLKLPIKITRNIHGCYITI